MDTDTNQAQVKDEWIFYSIVLGLILAIAYWGIQIYLHFQSGKGFYITEISKDNLFHGGILLFWGWSIGMATQTIYRSYFYGVTTKLDNLEINRFYVIFPCLFWIGFTILNIINFYLAIFNKTPST